MRGVRERRGQLARWATAGASPRTIDVRALRRFAAGLSESGPGPATVARKLAALRALLRVQVQLGHRAENPAELLGAPKRRPRLPHVIKATEVQSLLERIPATAPLQLRDRALFELAYSSGLRAQELVSLDLDAMDFDAELVRVEGKGTRPVWCPSASPPRRLCATTWTGPAVRSPTPGAPARCSCPSPAGGSPPPMCAGA